MMCFFHRLTLGFCLLLINNCELLNALLNAPSSVYFRRPGIPTSQWECSSISKKFREYPKAVSFVYLVISCHGNFYTQQCQPRVINSGQLHISRPMRCSPEAMPVTGTITSTCPGSNQLGQQPGGQMKVYPRF